jgi:vitamin B12 transporter
MKSKYVFFLCLLATMHLSVFAQIDTVNLGRIEISSTRTPKLYSENIRPVSVISSQQIELSPVNNLQDLLEYALGFDIRQRGVNGAQADVSMRGGSFEETLILLNGIRINDPQTGHHNLDLPIDLGHIERIEFLNGPGTRIYGTNAFSGAINIITSDEQTNKLKISVLGGDFGLFSGTLSGNFNTGKVAHYISLGGKTCEGYIKNTDFREGNAFYQGTLHMGTNNIELQAGYMNKSFGANSFYSAKYPDQFENTRTEFAAIKGFFGGRFRITPSIYWRRHHDRFELFRNDAPTWYKNHNYHMTDALGGEINASCNSVIGKTSVGVEYRYEHIYSNVLGELMTDTMEAPGEYNGFFIRAASRSLLSAFLDHQVTIKKINLSAGLMLHYSEPFGLGFYPGIDVAYEIKKGFSIYITANRALRLPTYTELYYTGPINIGNSNLKPEESWDFEGGLKFDISGFRGHIAGFYRMGYHLIDWIKYEGETIWHSDNLTQINTSGIEAGVTLNFAKILGHKFWLDEAGFSYQWLTMSKPNKDFISYYILDYLKHKAVLTINHRIWKNIGASWGLIYHDRAGTYTDAATGNEEPYKPYLLFDGKLIWDIKTLNIFVSVNNIFGTHYRDFSSVIMPGRLMSCGIRVEIH